MAARCCVLAAAEVASPATLLNPTPSTLAVVKAREASSATCSRRAASSPAALGSSAASCQAGGQGLGFRIEGRGLRARMLTLGWGVMHKFEPL